MQIRELEAKTGLERATIRYYEREGFIQPKRHDNGYREYSPEDCETLLKIKLLRKLGISLERIQDLQQGRADFSDALTEQIEALEDQMQAAERAKNVCEQMRCDDVSYRTLNAAYYLKILDAPVYGVKKVATAPVPEFQAKRYLKRHPVRRYVARTIDYTLLMSVLYFLCFVVLRIRFEVELLQRIITIGCIFLSVPVNAFLLSKLGTTPGKWVMGIRVMSCNGNHTTFEEAKDREWGVLRYGCGFYIPIYSLIRMIKSYKEYTATYENDWYRDTEVIYEDWTKVRRALSAILAVIILILAFSASFDIQRPIYREKNITISQFSENYNYVYKQVFGKYGEQLTTTGTFNRDPNTAYLDIGVVSIPQFQFDLEGEYIRSIRYEAEYLFALVDRQLPPQCIVAALCMVGAQKNVNMFEYLNFVNKIGSALQEELLTNQTSGEIVVKNVKVTWSEEFDIDVSLINAMYRFEVSLVD